MSQVSTDWYGPDTATFGDRVAASREGAGMTQAQLSRRLGVKKNTLMGWEQDLSEPRANKLSMMAGLVNVSIMWLLTGEGDGLTAPTEDAHTADFTGILAELHEIRSSMRANTERTARLEKKLRLLLEQGVV
jgi:transcriptional regulator with XRE-family HTH domain